MLTRDYEFPQLVLYTCYSHNYNRIYYLMHFNTFQQLICQKDLQRLLPTYSADINVQKMVDIIDELEKNKEVSENS